ncbi:MAG: endonuclease domain-containing protein [Proteobacteria bacterium]|nr:endonuclease domain-containing protein [Pseudomonadota bacterium]
MLRYDKGLKDHSRRLRSSMTEAETALWARLRRKQLLGLQFNRQKPLGRFIVDFYCPSANLVIELDGSQHYTQEGKVSDGLRDEELRKMGLFIMRLSNLDVLNNMDGVITMIYRYLETQLSKTETKSP